MKTIYAFVPSLGHEYPDHPERPGRLEILEPHLNSFEEVCKHGPKLLILRPPRAEFGLIDGQIMAHFRRNLAFGPSTG